MLNHATRFRFSVCFQMNTLMNISKNTLPATRRLCEISNLFRSVDVMLFLFTFFYSLIMFK